MNPRQLAVLASIAALLSLGSPVAGEDCPRDDSRRRLGRCEGPDPVPELAGRVPDDNHCRWVDIHEPPPAGFRTVIAWVDALTLSPSGGRGVVEVDWLRI